LKTNTRREAERALRYGGQSGGQHANPHVNGVFETHAEPEGHESSDPHLHTGVTPLVSQRSLEGQQMVPHRGPSAHPPLGAHSSMPPAPAVPPVAVAPPAPPVALPPELDPLEPPLEVPPVPVPPVVPESPLPGPFDPLEQATAMIALALDASATSLRPISMMTSRSTCRAADAMLARCTKRRYHKKRR
jgi:hypothetical protein